METHRQRPILRGGTCGNSSIQEVLITVRGPLPATQSRIRLGMVAALLALSAIAGPV